MHVPASCPGRHFPVGATCMDSEAIRRLHNPRAKHHKSLHTASGATQQVLDLTARARTVAAQGLTNFPHMPILTVHAPTTAGRTPVNIDYLDLTGLARVAGEITHNSARSTTVLNAPTRDTITKQVSHRPTKPTAARTQSTAFVDFFEDLLPKPDEFKKPYKVDEHTSTILVDQMIARHSLCKILSATVNKAYAFAKGADRREEVDSLYRYGRGHFHCRIKGCDRDHDSHTEGHCETKLILADYEEHLRKKHNGSTLYSCIAKNCSNKQPHGFARASDLSRHLDTMAKRKS